MSPIALFLCGIPCSGKTRYASSARFDSYEYISSEDYILAKMEEHSLTEQETLLKYRGGIKKYIKNRIIETVTEGKSFILDQTNTYSSARIKKLKLLPPEYHKKAVYFIMDLDVAFARAKAAYELYGKYTYPNLIRHFYAEYTYPTRTEGFDEILGISVTEV